MKWFTAIALLTPFCMTSPVNANSKDCNSTGPIYTLPLTQHAVFVAVHPTQPRIYVSHEGGFNQQGRITVLQTGPGIQSISIRDNIQVSTDAFGLNISPDGQRLFVACRNADVVAIVTLDSQGDPTGEVVHVPVGSSPHFVTFNSTGTLAYTSNWNDGTVTTIDTTTLNTQTCIVGDGPRDVLVSPDGSRFLVCHDFSDTLTLHDSSSCSIIGNPLSLGFGPGWMGMALSSTGTELYIPNNEDATISRVNIIGDLLHEQHRVSVGANPTGIALSPDNALIYAAMQLVDELWILDAYTLAHMDTINVGDGPIGVALDPKGTRLYVINNAHDSPNASLTTVALNYMDCNNNGVLDGCEVASDMSFVESELTSVTHANGGFVSHNGKLYLWGGIDGNLPSSNDNTARLEIFSHDANAWSDGASMPEAMRGMGEFELSGFLYSVGGERNPAGSFSDIVLRYDPGADTWQQLNNFPTIIWDPQSAVCDGRAFMIGGRHGYGQTNDHVYEYDAGSDSWSLRAPMPYHVMSAGVACHNGKVYVFGGNHKISEPSNEWVRHLQVYDVATDSWQFVANAMPRQLAISTAIAYGGRILVFARQVFDIGLGQFVDNELVDIYDPALDSWNQQSLTWPQYNGIHTGTVAINNLAYFVDWYTPSSEHSRQLFRLNLAAGTSQDCNSNGVPDECESDSDGDGYIDDCDGCPHDPDKNDPGICGCGVAETDTDSDGVPDCNDNCPSIPNSDQADCDGDGAGDLCDGDIDGDGVPNEADGCPNTPNCEVMPDGRPRLDMNGDCNVDGLDLQLIVESLLNNCSNCPS